MDDVQEMHSYSSEEDLPMSSAFTSPVEGALSTINFAHEGPIPFPEYGGDIINISCKFKLLIKYLYFLNNILNQFAPFLSSSHAILVYIITDCFCRLIIDRTFCNQCFLFWLYYYIIIFFLYWFVFLLFNLMYLIILLS